MRRIWSMQHHKSSCCAQSNVITYAYMHTHSELPCFSGTWLLLILSIKKNNSNISYVKICIVIHNTRIRFQYGNIIPSRLLNKFASLTYHHANIIHTSGVRVCNVSAISCIPVKKKTTIYSFEVHIKTIIFFYFCIILKFFIKNMFLQIARKKHFLSIVQSHKLASLASGVFSVPTIQITLQNT